MDLAAASVVGIGVASPLVLVFWILSIFKLRKRNKEIAALEAKLAPLRSLENEVAGLKTEAGRILDQVEAVKATYREKRALLDKLEKLVAVYDERLAFAELGIYEPHFDFRDSETFKNAITEVRSQQKAMVSAKTATISPGGWTVGGSEAKGKTMMARQTRLTKRAFNNECEAAIANARWNNVGAMETRIHASGKAIDAANETMQLRINGGYVALKIKELRLPHEWRERQKVEKEERAELARAEREERKFQEGLAQAQAAVGAGDLTAAARQRIAELETARAMAEMTRSGYVYVISNVGSFGEDMVKIGLTRRLNPDDRVRELGDASVPFSFDVHAMIHSDEAPALESALHREFAARRVNTSNMRKKFFRVTLDEVEEAVDRLEPGAGFFKDREAQEWHETMAHRTETLDTLHRRDLSEPPDAI